MGERRGGFGRSTQERKQCYSGAGMDSQRKTKQKEAVAVIFR